ncbi:MAG: hypothetical protein MUO64_07730, partial [Anaerolineales bacterium]|nr:hypothetical protein [Anaerolineales bacterium]
MKPNLSEHPGDEIFPNTAGSRQTAMTWVEHIPKVELHLHLEGAIPHPALWELAQKYGGDSTIPDLPALVRRFEYRDFPHFIETWNGKTSSCASMMILPSSPKRSPKTWRSRTSVTPKSFSLHPIFPATVYKL